MARRNDACRICGNAANNRTHVAREMMFGLREPFTYLECGQCGCVQLLDVPRDMARYYPPGYYSLRQQGWLKTAIRRQWSAYAYGAKSSVGWLFTKCFFQHPAMRAVRRVGISPRTRILEAGCGAGNMLLDLKYLGFPNVTGVDPFIERELVYEGGPTIHKKELSDMSGQYDLIMLHHCFEHMDQPAEKINAMARLLAPGGKVMLRTPVASSYCWRHYGVNWVHLDAPRHLFLHTYQTIEILTRQAGLTVLESLQEGDESSPIASDAYAKDISMRDLRWPGLTPIKKLLNWRRLRKDPSRRR